MAAERNPNDDASDASPVVLVLVDVINHLEYEGGTDLLKHARPAARRIAALKQRAKAAGIPVIYANDNFGRWRDNFQEIIAYCTRDDVPGRPLAEMLRPEDDDYFVLKPRHSAFYGTPLDVLLDRIGARTLILCGFTTDMCVLFTGTDAHVRELRLVVPEDCSAAIRPTHHEEALAYIRRVFDADTRPADALDLDALRDDALRDDATA